MGNKIIKETKSELKKVIWPSAKDVANGTLAVTIISAIVGIYIMLVDVGSLNLVKFITNAVSDLIAK